MVSSETIGDDLWIILQKLAICADEKSIHMLIRGRERARIYPANWPVTGQVHSNHFEMSDIVLDFFSYAFINFLLFLLKKTYVNN